MALARCTALGHKWGADANVIRHSVAFKINVKLSFGRNLFRDANVELKDYAPDAQDLLRILLLHFRFTLFSLLKNHVRLLRFRALRPPSPFLPNFFVAVDCRRMQQQKMGQTKNRKNVIQEKMCCNLRLAFIPFRVNVHRFRNGPQWWLCDKRWLCVCLHGNGLDVYCCVSPIVNINIIAIVHCRRSPWFSIQDIWVRGENMTRSAVKHRVI